jgi:hypothetical protein
MADHSTHHEPLTACPNCGTVFDRAAAPPRYCPHCGQETVLHPPSVGEFLHEFVGHYVALEGKLWHTLRLLVLRPGRVTKEYLAGRRQRHVLPLRLYLSASFLFFLVAKFAGLAPDVGRNSARAVRPAAVAASAASRPVVPSAICGTPSTPPCTWLDRRLAASRLELETDPERAQAEFTAHFLAQAPYAVFFLLPLFAGALALVYRGRRMLFGEHLVFCMHLATFWFLAAALAVLVRAAGLPLFVVGAFHAVRALHVVYGGHWAATLARAAIAALACATLLLAALVLLSIAAAMQH